MSVPSIAPVKQAVVKALRDNAALKAAVSNEIHEGISPRAIAYPYCVYDISWSVRSYDWSSNQIQLGVGIWVISDDQVEAQNLDALVIETLHDKALSLGTSGIKSLYCRRISDDSMVDLDDAGKKVYQIGGTHEIWVTAT